MAGILFIGFKGKNNASGRLAGSLSPQCCLLTNSFGGLQKDIEKLPPDYDKAVLFGVDKNLHDAFRIERFAENEGVRAASGMDLEELAERFVSRGIKTVLSDTPTKYLCNAAYGRLIEKYSGNVVLIHIPTGRHFDEAWIPEIRKALIP